MSITDPTLGPADFWPLRFVPLEENPPDSPILLLLAGEAVVGEIARLSEEHGELVLDQHQDCFLRLDGCWSLVQTPTDDHVGATHVLYPAPRSTEDEDDVPLERELGAWAALTLRWARRSGMPARG